MLGTMERQEGGNSTPFYSQVVSNRFKKPLEAEIGVLGRGKQENRSSQEQADTRKKSDKRNE